MTSHSITVVVTKDGTYGFAGLYREITPKAVTLDGALTVAYNIDSGEPYLTFGQLPMPMVTKPTRNISVTIPLDNVSYMVNVPCGEGHKLEDMYAKFFAALEPVFEARPSEEPSATE